jgi:hypothetical protein
LPSISCESITRIDFPFGQGVILCPLPWEWSGGRQVVHLEQLERRLPSLRHPEEAELRARLRRWRWQLGLERLAMVAVRGTIASSLAVVGLCFAVWFAQGDAHLLWLGCAPLLAALALGALRWPSHHLTAVTVDRHLGLEERLATAHELGQHRSRSRFADLQLSDAISHARSTRPTRLALDARARNEALLMVAALVLAAAALALVPRLPRPQPATPPLAAEAVTELPPSADEQTQRAVPLDTPEETATSQARTQTAPPAADLAKKVQQEQAERSALDKLAQALSSVSAGQPAASAIQQGDFNAARDQLQSLADDADQLSEAAKQQLARGLQQAASATAQPDRALADREQQAAQALARSNYADQRQALRALADQVQRAGASSVPSDQLERDVGQLQQQASSPASQASASSSRSQPGTNQSGAGQPGQAAGSPGAADQGTASAGSGQSGDGAGQQTGAGVGTGSDPDLYSNEPARLETTGQKVQVPTRLGSGPGVRPADGSEDQQLPDPTLSGRTTSELGQSQQTGQVAAEQNLVPGEQRPVVRGYFR